MEAMVIESKSYWHLAIHADMDTAKVIMIWILFKLNKLLNN